MITILLLIIIEEEFFSHLQNGGVCIFTGIELIQFISRLSLHYCDTAFRLFSRDSVIETHLLKKVALH